MRERWRERFVEDIEDELDEKEQKDLEVKEEEEEKSTPSGEADTEEGYSTYEDGSGQVYVVKTESSEHAETETEATVENERQEVATEQTRPESSEQKEDAEASEENEHPQSATNTQSSKESTEHTTDSEQQAEQTERPRQMERPRSRTHEDVPEASSEQKNSLEESGTQKEHAEQKAEEGEEQQENQEQEKRLWPSLFPETREDRIRRMFREWHEETDRIWESLTEEEKEPFRERIRRRLQDEEDFEELMTRHGQERLRDDEEAREEIERYLYFRERLKEELDDGEALEKAIDGLGEELHIDPEAAREWAHYQSVPEELRDLLARETQYRWREYLREFREIGLPQSEEELRKAFDDMIFSDELEEMSKWFQICAMREQGQIATYVKDGEECFSSSQIHKLSTELEISEGKITEWLGGFVPARIMEYTQKNTEKAPRSILSSFLTEQEEIEAVRALYYDEGLTMLEVSRKLGYKSTKRVQRIFKEQNWTPRPAGVPRCSLDVEKAKNLHYRDGLTLREIAERTGYHESTIRKFFKKHGLKPRRDLAASKRVGRYRINLWEPEFLGIPIESVEQLLGLIQRYAMGIMFRRNFRKLIERARTHLKLVKKLKGWVYLDYGEVPALLKELGLPLETLRYLVRKAGRPRIYYFLEETKMEWREEVYREFVRRMNGVTTLAEMDRRLQTLFFYDEFLNSLNQAQNEEFSMKYFTFWEEFMKGGLIEDIAKRLKIGRTTINEWLRFSQVPTYAKYASLIPTTELPAGQKWLPLKLNIVTMEPERFIQVPKRVVSSKHILQVIKQLKELDTPEMQELRDKYGGLPLEVEFMYLLGLITSDGGFSHNIERSANVQFTAAKKYPWALGLGKAFQYAMGLFGFSSNRWADDIRVRHGKKQHCMVWGSETTPFFAWVERAVLGLRHSKPKSNYPIHAKWILETPREWRVAFIQGLADGDGWASVRVFRTGIGSGPNREFIKDFFTTFDIVSFFDTRNVVIGKHSEICKTQKLPLFRNAAERQQRLNTISEIIESLETRKATGEELELILRLSREGNNPGRIAVILWEKYKIARTPSSIYSILARNGENTESKR